ncbi:MAG: efflux transporter outer membrane subunit [Alphaproteobacteria bacterium]|nr:efflux transporter outer membrane subunit [Alphaproteobacteria bacterium]
MPDRRAEAGTLPEVWRDAPPPGALNEQELAAWWRGFNDPLLDQLVDEALAEGPSLQLAMLRVQEARALSRNTLSRYLPQIIASGQVQYTQSVDGPDLRTSTQALAGQGGESEQAIGAYGPQVSWEIPLYARIEAAAVGARANERSSAADLRGARAALIADVAQAYVDLRAAQNSRDGLAELVDWTDQLAQVVARSAEAGFASEADAADSRRLAESNRARLPGLVIEARRAENALAVLRGKAPGTEADAIAQALNAVGPTPSPALEAAPAAPADLLRLRPDVARAEAQTIIAAAELGIARADLLPQLSLGGGLSVTDNIIGGALIERGASLQLTPVVTMPLFDWGQRLAAVRVRDARFEQALVSYRDTVNQGVADAANALVALDQGRLRANSARAAEDAALRTAEGARAAYGAGIQSLADRIRAEQQLIDARLTRIDAEAAYARAAIQVYRAFGGGAAPIASAQGSVPSSGM